MDKSTGVTFRQLTVCASLVFIINLAIIAVVTYFGLSHVRNELFETDRRLAETANSFQQRNAQLSMEVGQLTSDLKKVGQFTNLYMFQVIRSIFSLSFGFAFSQINTLVA